MLHDDAVAAIITYYLVSIWFSVLRSINTTRAYPIQYIVMRIWIDHRYLTVLWWIYLAQIVTIDRIAKHRCFSHYFRWPNSTRCNSEWNFHLNVLQLRRWFRCSKVGHFRLQPSIIVTINRFQCSEQLARLWIGSIQQQGNHCEWSSLSQIKHVVPLA